MNKNYLKELVCEANKINPENEIMMERNRQKRLEEMSKNIIETMEYLDTCEENELLWATEVLEDLAEHFKSKELVVCVERNAKRCVEQETINQLNMVIEYMYKYF